jgi:hypothetical protein
MSIYCPFAEALGIEATVSILDIPEPEWNEKDAKMALSFINRKKQLERLNDGTHHFLNKEFQSNSGKKGFAKAIETGKHHSLQPKFREISSRRIVNGTHPFQNSECQKHNVMKGIQNGTHSSCKTHTCPHCGKVGKGGAMKKWHFDNCKERT